MMRYQVLNLELQFAPTITFASPPSATAVTPGVVLTTVNCSHTSGGGCNWAHFMLLKAGIVAEQLKSSKYLFQELCHIPLCMTDSL